MDKLLRIGSLILLLPMGGCTDDNSSDAELLFSPSACEAEPSVTVLTVLGLDELELAAEGLAVIRRTGAFANREEALASLAFQGPLTPSELSKTFEHGPLELWEAPANDFGAMAWVHSTMSEVVFSGSVVWMGGGGGDGGIADSSVLLGASPRNPPSYSTAPTRYWSDDGTLAAVAQFGLRSEAVARYMACDTPPSIVVHIYTPAVGLTNRIAARGLVIVAGRRAAGPPL